MTSQQATLTLEAAQRARDTAALAAKEALEASGIAASTLENADDAAQAANAAGNIARESFHSYVRQGLIRLVIGRPPKGVIRL